MLIDAERDDAEVLRIEDAAIVAAESPPPSEHTSLDELARILSDDRETALHETTEG